jgi:acetyl-CoA carboxylase biotin carboxyl carrier protein
MSSFDVDTESVRKIADLLKETGLNEIEYQEGDKRIRCVAAPTAAPAVAAAQLQLSTTASTVPMTEPREIMNGTPIEAPMVGTVYLAPEPGAVPFVKVGDKIKAGDTLLIIEAMKVMNPIKAPVAGTITEIFVGDAKPVEFGETLMVIA